MVAFDVEPQKTAFIKRSKKGKRALFLLKPSGAYIFLGGCNKAT